MYFLRYGPDKNDSNNGNEDILKDNLIGDKNEFVVCRQVEC